MATGLRAGIAALIAALPEKTSGGTDLDRHLKLGSTVSWQLHTFATSANPVAALQFVPGRPTISRLANAARRIGVPDALIERVLQAYSDFEEFTREHAGDRSTLLTLTSGISGDGDTDQFSWRRAAFRAESKLWGVHARTHVSCMITNRGTTPTAEDSVAIRGYIDARSLRRNATLCLKTRGLVLWSIPAGSNAPDIRSEPASLLLEEFCSHPLPEMTSASDLSGQRRIMRLRVPGIGKRSATTFFTTNFVPDANQGDSVPIWVAETMITLPVEVCVSDMLVPRGWADPATIKTTAFGNLVYPDEALSHHEEDRLPMNGSGVYLGGNLDALEIPDAPRYPEMIRHVLRAHGWEGVEFDVFRCRVPYPILHSAIGLCVRGNEG